MGEYIKGRKRIDVCMCMPAINEIRGFYFSFPFFFSLLPLLPPSPCMHACTHVHTYLPPFPTNRERRTATSIYEPDTNKHEWQKGRKHKKKPKNPTLNEKEKLLPTCYFSCLHATSAAYSAPARQPTRERADNSAAWLSLPRTSVGRHLLAGSNKDRLFDRPK